MSTPTIAVIGGGPAGLMAAEVIAATGRRVDLYEAMPSVGRKFLLAGKGGMNITHSEPFERFLGRYGTAADRLRPWLDAFGPDPLRAWCRQLGIETFVGSSGRVFPVGMKAAPLLRSWLRRLRDGGVNFHVRHRWCGWATGESGTTLHFATPSGPHSIRADAVLLALGGGSWPQLGSDGTWVPVLDAAAVEVAPLRPANCGFEVGIGDDFMRRPAGWSEHFRTRFAGQPLKSVAVAVADAAGDSTMRRGEFVITASGVEGGLIYALSATLRDAIERCGQVTIAIDLLPDKSLERVADEVAHPRGARSWASHLHSRVGIHGVKAGLLREILGAGGFADPRRLAAAIKALPVRLVKPRPLAEAISSAGGVRFAELDEGLMIRRLPGVFCAGEMIGRYTKRDTCRVSQNHGTKWNIRKASGDITCSKIETLSSGKWSEVVRRATEELFR